VLVIHGGAGTITREGSTPHQQADYRKALRKALEAGYDVLHNGGEAMDAVVAAVSVMEDSPLFNSGKGAVFNVAGKASIHHLWQCSMFTNLYGRMNSRHLSCCLNLPLLTLIYPPHAVAFLLHC